MILFDYHNQHLNSTPPSNNEEVHPFMSVNTDQFPEHISDKILSPIIVEVNWTPVIVSVETL